jgi:hypothetical protein
MNNKQRDYLYEVFCREAKYIPQMLEPYTITVNGKILRDKETDKLFEKFLKEKESQIKHTRVKSRGQ